MTTEQYRAWRKERSAYPGQGIFAGVAYCALGLTNEAGEAAGEIKKAWRDREGYMNNGQQYKAGLELGDTLWYLDAFAEELGFTLDDIMQMNVVKIDTREAEKRSE